MRTISAAGSRSCALRARPRRRPTICSRSGRTPTFPAAPMNLSSASPTRHSREAGTMSSQAAELARRLARNAEAVCRHYLSNGRRQGRYWVVGDVANTPGRSLYVRLTGPEWGKGAAGKWTDSATSQHGDLLDLIALNCGLGSLHDVLEEARSLLQLR